MKTSDTELQLLQTIYAAQGEDRSQRSLAGEAGLSLGMTNALLKRFAERGWVKLSHVSGRSLRYVMTSVGIEEVFKRTISYFSRATRSASLYRDRVDAFALKAASQGFTILVLEGAEELDFLFDYSCGRRGLFFVKNPVPVQREELVSRPDVVFVVSDLDAPAVPLRPASAEGTGVTRVYLSSILLGATTI